MAFGNEIRTGSSGNQGFYNGVATQSLRFDDGGVHTLTRTFSSDVDDDEKMTISVWAKRGNISNATQVIVSTYTAVRFVGELSWRSDDKISFDPGGNGDGASNSYTVQTTAKFRDVGAWYHILLKYDTTQGTDTNRVKLFVNGIQQILEPLSGSHSFPPQNYGHEYSYNGANNQIGNYTSVASAPLDGYLADFYFIDGTALDPTSFIEIKNGICIPKVYTGSYGTNGYRLEFKGTGTSQNSSGIGADTSGNDNHLTPTNLAALDITTDTPQNNFCTLNPLDVYASKTGTISEGNTKLTVTTSNLHTAVGTIAPKNGKWYWEVELDSTDGSNPSTSILR